MRLYRSRVEPTSKEIVDALRGLDLIEVTPEELAEVYKDVESVLYEYIRTEREITDRAKDIVARQGMDYGQVGRIRRNLAADKKFGLDDDGLDYIVAQAIEVLVNSGHVEEVFGEDHELNRVIVPIIRKQMGQDGDLDQEVRKKIKHLSEAEGSIPWEIEYQRIKKDIERLKKLD